VPKPPPHLKIKRAKVIVDDEGQKFLTQCDSCGEENYIVEGEKVRDEYRSAGGEISGKAQKQTEILKCSFDSSSMF